MAPPDPQRPVFPIAMRDGLAPAALVCGLWYAALVPVHLRGLGEPASAPVVAFAAATAAAFFALAWLWWRRPPSPDRTDRCVAGVALLVLVNNVQGAAHVTHPVYLVGFYLEIVALGLFVLSRRWFVGLLLVVLAGFALGPLRGGWSASWQEPAVVALGSSVLATLMHASLSTYRRRLEVLRREREARGLELEQSLARLRAEVAHRERLQAQLARAERLESLGLLAGGIAHDFNNLLAIVVGNASLGLGRPVAPDLRESLESILAASDRAQLLSGQLLAYAGRRERRPVPLDLGEEVRALVDLERRGLPEGVVLSFEPSSTRSVVLADRAQLQQVVSNLVVNAAEATRHAGGAVRVRLGTAELDAQSAAELEPSEPRARGRYAFVRVADDGCGMDAETVAHVFDPFFTTKGLGRGLGLAAALGTARSHGGGFSVASEAGRGTVFTLFLPEVDAEPAATAPADASDARAPSATLLVVDDDDGVRATAARALRAAGHRVVEAAGGREAVAALRSTPGIALAVVDMTMPGMSGEETLHALRALRPKLPILLSSGYDVHEAALRLTALPGVAFLAKPYRAGEIAACARRLLEGRPADRQG